MIIEDMRGNRQDLESALAAGRAGLEQCARLRKLVRTGMGQVQSAVMGAQLPIRSMVANVQAEFSRHLAEADALMPAGDRGVQVEFAGELGTLAALCAWPEDNDELELALRFQELAPVLLDAVASEERHLETARNDLAVSDPFGC
jgi:hypothetical protein